MPADDRWYHGVVIALSRPAYRAGSIDFRG